MCRMIDRISSFIARGVVTISICANRFFNAHLPDLLNPQDPSLRNSPTHQAQRSELRSPQGCGSAEIRGGEACNDRQNVLAHSCLTYTISHSRIDFFNAHRPDLPNPQDPSPRNSPTHQAPNSGLPVNRTRRHFLRGTAERDMIGLAL